eukprot:g11379.t1
MGWQMGDEMDVASAVSRMLKGLRCVYGLALLFRMAALVAVEWVFSTMWIVSEPSDPWFRDVVEVSQRTSWISGLILASMIVCLYEAEEDRAERKRRHSHQRKVAAAAHRKNKWKREKAKRQSAASGADQQGSCSRTQSGSGSTSQAQAERSARQRAHSPEAGRGRRAAPESRHTMVTLKPKTPSIEVAAEKRALAHMYEAFVFRQRRYRCFEQSQLFIEPGSVRMALSDESICESSNEMLSDMSQSRVRQGFVRGGEGQPHRRGPRTGQDVRSRSEADGGRGAKATAATDENPSTTAASAGEQSQPWSFTRVTDEVQRRIAESRARSGARPEQVRRKLRNMMGSGAAKEPSSENSATCYDGRPVSVQRPGRLTRGSASARGGYFERLLNSRSHYYSAAGLLGADGLRRSARQGRRGQAPRPVLSGSQVCHDCLQFFWQRKMLDFGSFDEGESRAARRRGGSEDDGIFTEKSGFLMTADLPSKATQDTTSKADRHSSFGNLLKRLWNGPGGGTGAAREPYWPFVIRTLHEYVGDIPAPGERIPLEEYDLEEDGYFVENLGRVSPDEVGNVLFLKPEDLPKLLPRMKKWEGLYFREPHYHLLDAGCRNKIRAFLEEPDQADDGGEQGGSTAGLRPQMRRPRAEKELAYELAKLQAELAVVLRKLQKKEKDAREQSASPGGRLTREQSGETRRALASATTTGVVRQSSAPTVRGNRPRPLRSEQAILRDSAEELENKIARLQSLRRLRQATGQQANALRMKVVRDQFGRNTVSIFVKKDYSVVLVLKTREDFATKQVRHRVLCTLEVDTQPFGRGDDGKDRDGGESAASATNGGDSAASDPVSPLSSSSGQLHSDSTLADRLQHVTAAEADAAAKTRKTVFFEQVLLARELERSLDEASALEPDAPVWRLSPITPNIDVTRSMCDNFVDQDGRTMYFFNERVPQLPNFLEAEPSPFGQERLVRIYIGDYVYPQAHDRAHSDDARSTGERKAAPASPPPVQRHAGWSRQHPQSFNSPLVCVLAERIYRSEWPLRAERTKVQWLHGDRYHLENESGLLLTRSAIEAGAFHSMIQLASGPPDVQPSSLRAVLARVRSHLPREQAGRRLQSAEEGGGEAGGAVEGRQEIKEGLGVAPDVVVNNSSADHYIIEGRPPNETTVDLPNGTRTTNAIARELGRSNKRRLVASQEKRHESVADDRMLSSDENSSSDETSTSEREVLPALPLPAEFAEAAEQRSDEDAAEVAATNRADFFQRRIALVTTKLRTPMFFLDEVLAPNHAAEQVRRAMLSRLVRTREVSCTRRSVVEDYQCPAFDQASFDRAKGAALPGTCAARWRSEAQAFGGTPTAAGGSQAAGAVKPQGPSPRSSRRASAGWKFGSAAGSKQFHPAARTGSQRPAAPLATTPKDIFQGNVIDGKAANGLRNSDFFSSTAPGDPNDDQLVCSLVDNPYSLYGQDFFGSGTPPAASPHTTTRRPPNRGGGVHATLQALASTSVQAAEIPQYVPPEYLFLERRQIVFPYSYNPALLPPLGNLAGADDPRSAPGSEYRTVWLSLADFQNEQDVNDVLLSAVNGSWQTTDSLDRTFGDLVEESDPLTWLPHGVHLRPRVYGSKEVYGSTSRQSQLCTASRFETLDGQSS